jgi:cysteine synthase A
MSLSTILTKYGTRYQSAFFNPEFLRAKKLPVPACLERKSAIKPLVDSVMAAGGA